MHCYRVIRFGLFLLLSSLAAHALGSGTITAIGQPEDLDMPGFEHIQWQQVTYSQGDCPLDLTAIFYWSPNHVTASNNDNDYTPYVLIHGGAWAKSAIHTPPPRWELTPEGEFDDKDIAQAQGIQDIVSRGVMYMLPTYRGVGNFIDNPEIESCDHPRELIKDAEFILGAINARDPALPMTSLLRDGDNLRVLGGSAGAHVAMAVAANHPEWFDRLLGALGVYDLHYLHDNWDLAFTGFGNRHLEKCELKLGDKVSAVTAAGQGEPRNTYEVSFSNCARVPELLSAGRYRITERNNPAKWAIVSRGFFVEWEKPLDAGGTELVTLLLEASILYPNVIHPESSSEPDGSLPDFDTIDIEEVDAFSVPIIPPEEAMDSFVTSQKRLVAGLLDNLFNTSFLAIPKDDPILLENSLGEVIKSNGTGAYPPFILGTNSGDFTLQEQAIEFCNDVQLADGLPINTILSKTAKNTQYQCGDKGTLSIDVGGSHLSSAAHSAGTGNVAMDWLFGNSETSHAAKPYTCAYDDQTASVGFWSTAPNTGDFLTFLDGDLIGKSFYDDQIHTSEWKAIQNDPAYFGKDVTSFTYTLDYYGYDVPLYMKAGSFQTANQFVGLVHEICWRLQ